MTSLQIGEQSTEPVFGVNPETLTILILAFTAGFFCWYLYQEHTLSKFRTKVTVELQTKFYDRCILADLEKRFEEGA